MNTAEQTNHRDRAASGPSGQRTNGQRSTEELEQDIERRRENIDRTLSALERKLSPGELLDEGLSYMKSGPGQMLGNLARAAKDNPVPMVLTGVGLAWLMLSDNRSSGRTEGSRATGSSRDQGSEDVGEVYAAYLVEEYPFTSDELEYLVHTDLGPEVGHAYSGRSRSAARQGGGVQDAARSATERAGEKAAEIKDAAQTATDRAAEKAGEVTQQVKASAEELRKETQARLEAMRARMEANSAEAMETIRAARERATERVRQGGRAIAAEARLAADKTGEFIDRYPLSLMALGVAAGAALGTALPETRRENRLMGDYSDTMKDEVRERVEHEKRRAGRVAEVAMDAAVGQAEKEGLSAEGVKEAAAGLKDRAGRVFDAAKAETERQDLTAEAAREQVDETKEKVERVASAARDAASKEGKNG